MFSENLESPPSTTPATSPTKSMSPNPAPPTPSPAPSPTTASLIAAALSKNALFGSLPPAHLANVVAAMRQVLVAPGASVISQGDDADAFYVVEAGTLDVFKDGKQVNELSAGDLFGELALLYNVPRSASVVAATAGPAVTLWTLGRSTFRRTMAAHTAAGLRSAGEALAGVSLLADLTDGELTALAAAVQHVAFPPGATIITKGDVGDTFYMVREGTVVCTDIGSGGVPDVTLGAGDYFGERALLMAEPRAANVVAVSHVTAFALGREPFVRLLGPLHDTLRRAVLRRSLPSLPLFRHLPPDLVANIAEGFSLRSFAAGEHIVEAGQECTNLYLVKSGAVGLGEASRPPFSTAIRSPMAHSKRAPKTPRTPNVGLPSGSHSLSPTATSPREAPAGRCVGKYFGGEALVADPANPNRRWLAVLTAEATPSAPPSPTTPTPGRHALPPTIEATVVAETDVEVFELSYAKLARDLTSVGLRVSGSTGLPVSTEDGVPTPPRSPAHATAPKSSPTTTPVEPASASPTPALPLLKDLTRLRTLGVGAFGRVYLVRHEPTQTAYALKEMEKARLIRCKQTTNVISEKRVMQQVSHPFLLRLVTTYRDDAKLYMLMELVQGGELFSVLSRHDRLKPPAARFYAACVLAGLEALHLGGVVYRDLKPENILIDASGYCKLVDFGFAKRVTSRTYTLCGTPEYMAPELVLGKGYDRSADVWALGILIYEMLVGRTPFADASGRGNKMTICENIIRGGLRFPKDMYTDAESMGPVRRVVRALLDPSVIRRLGCSKRGAADIKAHAFFEGVSWSALARRRLTAPWVPPLSGPFDTSFFDEEYDESAEGGKPMKAAAGATSSRLPSDWDKEFDAAGVPPPPPLNTAALRPPVPLRRPRGNRGGDTRTKLLKRNLGRGPQSPGLRPPAGLRSPGGLRSPAADSVVGELYGGDTPTAARGLGVDTGGGRLAPPPGESPTAGLPSPANSVIGELHGGVTPRLMYSGGRHNPGSGVGSPDANPPRPPPLASPGNSVVGELYGGDTPRGYPHVFDTAGGRDAPGVDAGDDGLGGLGSPAAVFVGGRRRRGDGGGGGGGDSGDEREDACTGRGRSGEADVNPTSSAAEDTTPRVPLRGLTLPAMLSPTSSIAGELYGGVTPLAARLADPQGRIAPTHPAHLLPSPMPSPSASSIAGELAMGLATPRGVADVDPTGREAPGPAPTPTATAAPTPPPLKSPARKAKESPTDAAAAGRKVLMGLLALERVVVRRDAVVRALGFCKWREVARVEAAVEAALRRRTSDGGGGGGWRRVSTSSSTRALREAVRKGSAPRTLASRPSATSMSSAGSDVAIKAAPPRRAGRRGTAPLGRSVSLGGRAKRRGGGSFMAPTASSRVKNTAPRKNSGSTTNRRAFGPSGARGRTPPPPPSSRVLGRRPRPKPRRASGAADNLRQLEASVQALESVLNEP